MTPKRAPPLILASVIEASLRLPVSYHVYTECLIRKHVNHLWRLHFSSQDGTVATVIIPTYRWMHHCNADSGDALCQAARVGTCRKSSWARVPKDRNELRLKTPVNALTRDRRILANASH